MWIQSQVRINLPTLPILALCFGMSVEMLASANEQVLRSFGGALFRDGQYPQASLVQGLDGALYGTSTSGGTNDAGALFKINVDGSGYQVLYGFDATNGGASRALCRAGARGRWHPLWNNLQGRNQRLRNHLQGQP